MSDSFENFDMDAASDQISLDLGFEVDEPFPSSTDPVDTGTTTLPVDENAPAATTEQTGDPKVEQPTPTEFDKDPATTDPETVAPTAAAPKTWRKEAAAEWANLPPTVQAEIHKREEDMYKGIEQYKTDASVGTAFRDLINPHLGRMQTAGYNPWEEVSSLLNMHQIMTSGTPEQRKGLFLELSSLFDIDLLDVAEAQSSAPYVDPAIKALQDEIKQLKSGRQQEDIQRQATFHAEKQREIESFFDNKTDYPYADEVADAMTGLIAGGLAKDLKSAYEQACRITPSVIAKEQARLTAEAQSKAKAEADKALKLKSASVTANARPVSATAPVGSIDDTLSATLAEIRSRT